MNRHRMLHCTLSSRVVDRDRHLFIIIGVLEVIGVIIVGRGRLGVGVEVVDGSRLIESCLSDASVCHASVSVVYWIKRGTFQVEVTA